MNFTFTDLQIPDVKLIKPRVFADDRGFFAEIFKVTEFYPQIPEIFVQDNHSRSKENTLRGLHYQTEPEAQGKLVSVIKGEIFDVAVDIRKDSPTFGKWVARNLSGDNHEMLYIPPGFAHGFLALEGDTHVVYKVTKEYSSEHEKSIIWNDPQINIDWPIYEPLLAEKDQNALTLAEI